jgi:hypothetical protein
VAPACPPAVIVQSDVMAGLRVPSVAWCSAPAQMIVQSDVMAELRVPRVAPAP